MDKAAKRRQTAARQALLATEADMVVLVCREPTSTHSGQFRQTTVTTVHGEGVTLTESDAHTATILGEALYSVMEASGMPIERGIQIMNNQLRAMKANR